jgi:hypothetical protein
MVPGPPWFRCRDHVRRHWRGRHHLPFRDDRSAQSVRLQSSDDLPGTGVPHRGRPRCHTYRKADTRTEVLQYRPTADAETPNRLDIRQEEDNVLWHGDDPVHEHGQFHPESMAAM